MKTSLSHIQFNVRSENIPFYRDLFGFLGWPVSYEGEGMAGVSGPNGDSIWFGAQTVDAPNDRDGAGLNHLGIGAESIADVDATVAYLQSIGIQPLFETPRHRPEFAADENSTYYQVMFDSPDSILVEVVYMGPK
jgi:catechol 2,3-dioxygenase-like lactoylglutathione lyase family enzyme